MQINANSLVEPTSSERQPIIEAVPTPSPNELLTRQALRESNARSYPRRLPIGLKRGNGLYVEDVDGRVYIDCLAAAGTLALGHNHPVIVEAIERALHSAVPMQTLDLTTPIKDEFIEELFATLPTEFARHAKIQFCGPTGTDAVEAALKLVKTATGRRGMFAFQGAYHGQSLGALSLMGNLGPKRALDGALGGVQFLPFPYAYRCPFGIGGEAGEAAGLAYIHNLLNDPESGVLRPAGVIVEAIQGEGGVIPASDSWLRRLRELCSESEVPLILDEIQTGFCRTGRRFAFEYSAIIPDVVVLSKALGGGLPLSVLVYHESLDVWQPGAHAGTFRGNQLAMATGIATLKFIRKEGLEQHAAEMGQRLERQLRQLADEYACVGDVRGKGLMLGLEMVDINGARDNCQHPPASPGLASAIQRACLKRGLILEVGGRFGSTLRLLPPLIINALEVDRVAAILADAVSACARLHDDQLLG